MGETIDDSNAASTPDVGSSGRIDPAAGARTAREDAQRRDMMSTLERGGFLRDWATTWQHEGERVLLERLRDGLRGDVLELASGGGRLTRRLIEIAGSLHGFDIAPDMVAYCQETFPSATFSQLEYSGLSRWDGESWDAVCSGCNSFDVLTDEERNALFGNVARLLRPGGIFVGQDSLDLEPIRAAHDDDTFTPVDPDQMKDRLAAAGFGATKTDVVGFHFRFVSQKPG